MSPGEIVLFFKISFLKNRSSFVRMQLSAIQDEISLDVDFGKGPRRSLYMYLQSHSIPSITVRHLKKVFDYMYDKTGRFYKNKSTIMLMQIHFQHLIVLEIRYIHWLMFDHLTISACIFVITMLFANRYIRYNMIHKYV